MSKKYAIFSILYWIVLAILDITIVFYVEPLGIEFMIFCGLSILAIAMIIFWVYCWLQTFK